LELMSLSDKAFCQTIILAKGTYESKFQPIRFPM
jgi:hypothetical protein